MQPVIQEEISGCGIASVANILGKSYLEIKKVANDMGIFATDKSLWSDTHYVRQLLKKFHVDASHDELPFTTWENVPDLALLAIKHSSKGGLNYWHWVVFKRVNGESFVLDSASYLTENKRIDFDEMDPKWFIECTY